MESGDGKKSRNTAGLRRGGGRPKGATNKVTREIRAIAQPYGPQAIETLAALLTHRNGAVRVAAARELLDRGYGKATQSHEHAGPGGAPITTQVLVSVGPSNQVRPA